MVSCLLAMMLMQQPGVPWGGYDYGQYYVAWKLIHSDKNPYDHAEVTRLQREHGYAKHLVTYAPPWSLLPAWPLSKLGYRQSIHAYMVVNSVLLLFSIICWARLLYPGKLHALGLAVAALVLWIPTWHFLQCGQISAWPFAGFTGWLFFHTRRAPFISGCFLALTIIKPHLGLLPGMFAGFYLLRHQQWRSIAAFALTVLVLTGVTFWVRPSIWAEYVHAMQVGTKVTDLYTGTLEGWLRYYFQVDLRLYSWLLFGLSLIAGGVLGWRLPGFPKRNEVPSLEDAAYVRLVYTATAICVATCVVIPYAFSNDFILLLPGLVIALIGWVRRDVTHQPALSHWLIFIGWMVLNIWTMLAKDIKTPYHFEMWFVPWFALALTGISLSYLSSARASTFPSPTA